MLNNDSPTYGGFTRQEAAALALKVPDSGAEWLDKMIIKSRLLDAKAACLAAGMDEGDAEYRARQAL
jgi:hypothetical protein